MEFYSITPFGYQKQNISALPPSGKWVMTDDGIIVVNDPFDKVLPLRKTNSYESKRINGIVNDIVKTSYFVLLEILSYDIDAKPHFHKIIKGNDYSNYYVLEGTEKTTYITNPTFTTTIVFHHQDTNIISHYAVGIYYNDHDYYIYDDVHVTNIDSITIGRKNLCFVDDILDEFICKGRTNNYSTEQKKLGKVGNKKVNACVTNLVDLFVSVGDNMVKMRTYGGVPAALRVDGTTYDFIECSVDRVAFGINSNEIHIWRPCK